MRYLFLISETTFGQGRQYQRMQSRIRSMTRPTPLPPTRMIRQCIIRSLVNNNLLSTLYTSQPLKRHNPFHRHSVRARTVCHRDLSNSVTRHSPLALSLLHRLPMLDHQESVVYSSTRHHLWPQFQSLLSSMALGIRMARSSLRRSMHIVDKRPFLGSAVGFFSSSDFGFFVLLAETFLVLSLLVLPLRVASYFFALSHHLHALSSLPCVIFYFSAFTMRFLVRPLLPTSLRCMTCLVFRCTFDPLHSHINSHSRIHFGTCFYPLHSHCHTTTYPTTHLSYGAISRVLNPTHK